MQRPADEELANTLTHALGAALALGAAAKVALVFGMLALFTISYML